MAKPYPQDPATRNSPPQRESSHPAPFSLHLFKPHIHHHDFGFACGFDRRSPEPQSAGYEKMGVPDLFMAPAEFVEGAHIKVDGEKLSVVGVSRELHIHGGLADFLKLGGTVVEHDDRQ